MAMLARDAAADPWVGDVFSRDGANGRILRRHVVAREEFHVVFQTDDPDQQPRRVWLPTFQDWAHSADVETAGADAPMFDT